MTCTVAIIAGLLASARKSYNRAKSEGALLVHFSSISEAPVTDCQYRDRQPAVVTCDTSPA